MPLWRCVRAPAIERVFLLEPSLHQRLIPFQRTMQRPLTSDPNYCHPGKTGGTPLDVRPRMAIDLPATGGSENAAA
jgi:hypothetical protein